MNKSIWFLIIAALLIITGCTPNAVQNDGKIDVIEKRLDAIETKLGIPPQPETQDKKIACCYFLGSRIPFQYDWEPNATKFFMENCSSQATKLACTNLAKEEYGGYKCSWSTRPECN